MELIEDTAGMRAGLAGDLLVFHHYAPITIETVAAIRRVSARIAAAGGQTLHLIIRDDNVPVPGAEVREPLAAAAKANEGKVKGVALVIRGQGFLTAAFRAALAGMTLFAKITHPVRVFGSLGEAVTWAASILGTPRHGLDATLRDIEAFVGRR